MKNDRQKDNPEKNTKPAQDQGSKAQSKKTIRAQPGKYDKEGAPEHFVE